MAIKKKKKMRLCADERVKNMALRVIHFFLYV